jgi:hypothetical protein
MLEVSWGFVVDEPMYSAGVSLRIGDRKVVEGMCGAIRKQLLNIMI